MEGGIGWKEGAAVQSGTVRVDPHGMSRAQARAAVDAALREY